MTKKTKFQSMQASFDQGVAMAMDPANDEAIQKGGKATTTLTSYWLLQLCPVCQHTFRLGDEVIVAEDRTVRHSSTLLPCAQGNVTNTGNSQVTSTFFKGLDETWPPPEGIPIVRLETGHKLLAEPGKFQRHTCAICGHTFRPQDLVMICPCRPNQPLCGTAVHRDPLHGLHCFDAWKAGAKQKNYCLTFLTANE